MGALKGEGLFVGYRRGPLVLRGLYIEVPAGRITGLEGPSGTGKSTLARALTGLLKPVAGKVTCDGVPVSARMGSLTGEIGMLFQSPKRSCSCHYRLYDVVAEPGRLRRGKARLGPDLDLDVEVRTACRRVGLTEDLLERLTNEVSVGQLQRAALARALVAKPKYLICDEATAMLDAATAATIANVIRQEVARGLGVLAISHDTELLRAWADEVLALGDLAGLV